MKKSLILLIVLLSGLLPVHATPIKSLKNRTIKELVIRYNPDQLRIPGKAFNIGINAILNDGKSASTKGYLNGSLRWRDFNIYVDKGYFARGKIFLTESSLYQKGNFVTITIYRKKGNKLIKTQKIPLHYETEIEVITKPGFSKAPGSIIKVGLRKWYSNEKYDEIWYSWYHKIENEFTYSAIGADYSHGKLRIYDDPFAITDHVASFEVSLKKNLEIKKKFSITLDYKKHYNYNSFGKRGMSGSNGSNGTSGCSGGNGADGYAGGRGSNGFRGPNLEIFATSYYDTIINAELLYVQVKNLYDDQIKNYFINVNGGSIDVLSRGGNGGSGGNGGTGGCGGNGSDGITYIETVYVNDSTTNTIICHGPGEDGGNGGNGGYGGSGGDGGRGGDIILFYTNYAQPYLHLIRQFSHGGNGGNGGFSGNGGSGGIGGSGSPSGHSGSSGHSGGSGHSGFDGRSGSIRCILVPEEYRLPNNKYDE